MFFIVFIGGIVFGKLIIVWCLVEYGVVVVDVDQIVCDVQFLGLFVFVWIVDMFGSVVIVVDGLFDWVVLGVIVFGDFDQFVQLNVIVYFVVWEELQC